MANIACGAHAGDLQTMHTSVDLALTYGVSVGAHPGYADRTNFGRKSIRLPAGEIQQLVTTQVQTLDAVCIESGIHVEYIKPHGALYHDMMSKREVFEEILQALCNFVGDLPLMIMARPDIDQYLQLAEKYGVPLIFEGFADRAYTDQGDLVDRSLRGAVLTSPEAMVDQALQIKSHGTLTSIQGNTIPVPADTLCVHGDNDAAVMAVKKLYLALQE